MPRRRLRRTSFVAPLLLLALAAGCSDEPPLPRGPDGRSPGDVGAATGPDQARPGDGVVGTDSVAADGLAPGDGPAGDGAKGDGPTAAAIWQPAPGTTWHWQLSGTIDQSVAAQMYDIDLFDTSAATIAALKSAGRVVICYFSAGSYEDWRPDAAQFPSAARGSKMDGWNELWIDTRSSGIRALMQARLDLAVQKGCDGVEPDNVDGYANDTGFPLSAADQLDYNKFLAAEAHSRGLSVGLKNDLDQVAALAPYFDWALNEECLQYDECDALAPFINAGKAVFHVEYTPASTASVCAATAPLKFSSIVKHLDLDAWFDACW